MNFAEFPRLEEAGLPKEVVRQFRSRLGLSVLVFICVFVPGTILGNQLSGLAGGVVWALIVLSGASLIFWVVYHDRLQASRWLQTCANYQDQLRNMPKADLVSALRCRYELGETEVKAIEEVLSEQHPGWSAELPGYPATTCPKCGSTCGSEGEGTHA